jgi:hypothetical protein
LLISLPTTMTLDDPPAGCTDTETIVCLLASIPSGGSVTFSFAVTLAGDGEADQVAVAVTSDGDANTDDNTASLIVNVMPRGPVQPVVVVPVLSAPTTLPATPVAGKRFIFTLAVKRGVTGESLRVGSMRCDTVVGNRAVRHVASFKAGLVRITLLVPTNATGKLLKVKVTIRSAGQVATRVISYRVR